MIPDTLERAAKDDPIAVALNDPIVRSRMTAAARAFLARRLSSLLATQRAAEAEAVVQEAAVRAVRHRERFDPAKNATNWLVGYVRNVAREFYKRQVSAAAESTPEGLGLDELVVDPARSVSEAVVDRLFLDQYLVQLPPIERDMLRMKYHEGQTCREIGEFLGMNENAVRVRLYRAIVRLRELCGVTVEGQP